MGTVALGAEEAARSVEEGPLDAPSTPPRPTDARPAEAGRAHPRPNHQRSAKEEVRAWARAYRATGDPRLRDRLVTTHRELAHALAARYARRGEELDDLNQVALIALLKAVERFDPDRGFELSTYATETILGELKRHMRDRAWSVRPPRRLHDLHLEAQGVLDEMTQQLGRSPTIPELAERLGAGVDDVLQALQAGNLRRAASLDAPLAPGEPAAIASLLGDVDDGFSQVEGWATLRPLLDRLPDPERTVVLLRFLRGYTQREIARRTGVSQMQVSRLLGRALARLRAWSEEAPSARPGRPARAPCGPPSRG